MKKILFSLLMLCCITAAWAQPWPPEVYEVGTLERFKEVISHRMTSDGKCIAEIKLTDDIYLNDCPELCRTFTGTLDGNGYTIYAGDENAHHDGRGFAHGKYLFTYSEGATFKNLNFKDFRADTNEHSNWSFLTSQATNGCVFENITFDHVSLWAKVDKGGAVAGYANGCSFKNITVKNGDFTVNGRYAGAVVGNAEGCTFTNIKVSKNDVTADVCFSGGVVGYSTSCTFQDIEINECNITTHDRCVGGISGESEKSRFINCKVDDLTGIFAADDKFMETDVYAEVGGIIGWSVQDECIDCINSAFVAGCGRFAGGIIGRAVRTVNIQNCVNTGMVVCVEKSDASDLYNKYKKKELAYDVKHYNGVEYHVRYLSSSQISDNVKNYQYYGGLVGGGGDLTWWGSKIENSASLGSIYSEYYRCCGIIGACTMTSACPMYIRNCLVDFKTGGNSEEYGIHSTKEAPIYVQNCLVVNSSGALGIPSYGTDFALGNVAASVEEYERLYCNYTLNPNVTRNGTKSSTNEEMHSGALAIKLGAAWEQNLGTDPYPTPTGNKGLYQSRNITNEYGTAYLPYAMTSDENISFYTFESETSDEEGITLKFKYAENVPARTPVLFRASGAPTAESPISITLSDAKDGYEWRDVAADVSGWTMEGTYQQRVFEGDEAKSIYYVSGGKIRNAKKTTIAPYRAFFHGPSIETLNGSNGAPAKAIRFVIEDADGTTTVIQSPIEAEGYKLKAEGTFNLAGQKVDENYRGIVIKNGKKVLVK